MSSHRYSRKWKNFRRRYAMRYIERCYSGDGRCSRCALFFLYCECPEKNGTGDLVIALEWRIIAHQLQGGRSAAPN